MHLILGLSSSLACAGLTEGAGRIRNIFEVDSRSHLHTVMLSRSETSPREAPVDDTQGGLLETAAIGERRENAWARVG